MKSLSRVWLLSTQWTVAYQASPSMGFCRQEYWSGLPFPFPGGSSPPRDRTQVSLIGGRHFNLWATREALRRVGEEPKEANLASIWCKLYPNFLDISSLLHPLILQLLDSNPWIQVTENVTQTGFVKGDFVSVCLKKKNLEWHQARSPNSVILAGFISTC